MWSLRSRPFSCLGQISSVPQPLACRDTSGGHWYSEARDDDGAISICSGSPVTDSSHMFAEEHHGWTTTAQMHSAAARWDDTFASWDQDEAEDASTPREKTHLARMTGRERGNTY